MPHWATTVSSSLTIFDGIGPVAENGVVDGGRQQGPGKQRLMGVQTTKAWQLKGNVETPEEALKALWRESLLCLVPGPLGSSTVELGSPQWIPGIRQSRRQ